MMSALAKHRWPRHARGISEDTDSQRQAREAFLESTLGPEYQHGEVAAFLRPYTLYVDQSVQLVSKTITQEVLRGICNETVLGNEDTTTANLRLAQKIAGYLQQEILNNKQTLDGVVDKILKSSNIKADNESATLQTCRCLVFTILGLSTMLFEPVGLLETLRRGSDAYKNNAMPVDMCERPIRTLLIRLKALHSNMANANAPDSDTDAEALLSANLSFSSLRAVGRISIEWVNSMDNHLEFDPDRRVLSLFRYPSFCASSCSEGASHSLLAKITATTSEPEKAASEALVTHVSLPYAKEILQSYRVLFAQDKKSRGLYWNTVRPLVRKDDLFDPFLDDLCGRRIAIIQERYPRLRSILDIRGSVFRPQEFPHYGIRLRTIQQYIERHRPRRVMDLWRDRRDPEKILTLWVVLAFGVISIFLSLVQTVLTGVQVWLTQKQLRQS